MKKMFLFSFLTLSLFLAGCSSQEVVSTDIIPFESDSPLVHDWQDINIMGGNVEKIFTLTNTHSDPVPVVGAFTSCMCTTAVITLSDGSSSDAFGMHGDSDWSYVVQPGESFDVTVTFDPLAHGPSATGPIQRTVNIVSDLDSETKGVIYTRIDVRGNVLSEADYTHKHGMNSSHDSTSQADTTTDLADYEVSTDETSKAIKRKGEVILVDVREDQELAETGIIEGAIHIPLGSLSVDTLTAFGVQKGDKVILYCRSGNRSHQAYELLSTLGYTQAKSMAGGILKWQEDEKPLVTWVQ